jgi:hypothetical protein
MERTMETEVESVDEAWPSDLWSAVDVSLVVKNAAKVLFEGWVLLLSDSASEGGEAGGVSNDVDGVASDVAEGAATGTGWVGTFEDAIGAADLD